jgi:hypothetical protein
LGSEGGVYCQNGRVSDLFAWVGPAKVPLATLFPPHLSKPHDGFQPFEGRSCPCFSRPAAGPTRPRPRTVVGMRPDSKLNHLLAGAHAFRPDRPAPSRKTSLRKRVCSLSFFLKQVPIIVPFAPDISCVGRFTVRKAMSGRFEDARLPLNSKCARPSLHGLRTGTAPGEPACRSLPPSPRSPFTLCMSHDDRSRLQTSPFPPS